MSTPVIESAYMPIPAAAKYLGVSVATIYRRISDGTLQAYDVAPKGARRRTPRVARTDIDALLRPLGPTGLLE